MSGVRLVSEGEERRVRLEGELAWVDERKVPSRAVRRQGDIVAIERDGELLPIRVARDGDRVFVGRAGGVFEVRREPVRPAARAGSEAADHGTGLTAPMPGRIRRTLVRLGDSIERGQVVLVLEAMKMEHAIRAPRDGTVTRLDHVEGDLVEAGAELAEIT
ncbi:MAG: HlyD family efflux transporter periplasmic adaptor subunit [Acidobacteriota bacterium]|nr:HlyD family efflux transporter periplasmic adaptor subunit [Acidobacteriota bacterium]